MLRIIQSMSAAGAKSYYSTADYYTEGQELQGSWRGLLADRLGLSGAVRQEDWDALCDNRDPHSGAKLTPRDKSVRRVGYDLNFHAPKSLSALFAMTHDERLLGAFREAVGVTMNEIERDMRARVRRSGKNEDRTTGNMLWGEFTHFTARPVDGVPDPHLHAHCFAFNLTYDDQEARMKAGQFAVIKRDAPYFEAVFHSHLARRMEELGLGVERTKTGWEIAGVPGSVIEKFSRRTAQIEAKAKELGIDSDQDKDGLGAKTRDSKVKDLSMDELRGLWRNRLTSDEQSALDRVRDRVGEPPIGEDDRSARDGVHMAIDHCFERSAVVPERTVLAEALKRSVGKATPTSVAQALASHSLLRRNRDDRWLVTSKEVLGEEQRMLDFARSGRGSCRPLGTPDHGFTADLGADQKKAVLHVLTSMDRVIVVRGAAGTGKTTMMTEAVVGIEAGGKQVFTFAPSASASRGVLRSEGFASADTVARLLVDEKLQEHTRSQVLWIDEAGLLGSRTTARLFDLADRLNARVILSGDKRQHGSVERGGVLRLLETEAGIAPVELRDIRRQKGEYKAAVRDLSDGHVKEGFERLDQLGWVHEIGDQERYRVLADAYVKSCKEPGRTLVVCPTHGESDRITTEIRSALKSAGALGTSEQDYTILRPINMTQAQRADVLAYLPGDILVLHQNVSGHTRGDRLIVGRDPLPLDHPDRFGVYRPSTLSLTKGDRVRITRNYVSKDKSVRVNNGDLHTIASIARNGSIMLDNGAVLPRAFGFLDYGYVVTSHASQGKSVERVIIGQSSASAPASSMEQFYVSVSRGKQKATIFTDDKRALLEAVGHGDTRLTATDLVAGRDAQGRAGSGAAGTSHGRSVPARRRPPAASVDSSEILTQTRGAPDREGVTHER